MHAPGTYQKFSYQNGNWNKPKETNFYLNLFSKKFCNITRNGHTLNWLTQKHPISPFRMKHSKVNRAWSQTIEIRSYWINSVISLLLCPQWNPCPLPLQRRKNPWTLSETIMQEKKKGRGKKSPRNFKTKNSVDLDILPANYAAHSVLFHK